MDLPSKLAGLLSPFKIDIKRRDEKIVFFNKCDSYDLEVCIPKVIRREKSLFRSDRLDSFHLKPDGSIEYREY